MSDGNVVIDAKIDDGDIGRGIRAIKAKLDGLNTSLIKTAAVGIRGFKAMKDKVKDLNRSLLETSVLSAVSLQTLKSKLRDINIALIKTAVLAAGISLGASLIPMLAATTAGVLALGSSLAAAGIGAAAFGAVAVGALTKVFKAAEEVATLEEKIANADSAKERIAAQKELAAVYAGMSKEQRFALTELQNFKSFWGDFVKQFEKPIFASFGTGLHFVEELLKRLAPTITNVSAVVLELMESLDQDISNGGFKGFFDWLETNAAESLMSWATIAGNTFSGFFSLLQAFTPLGASMEEGLVGMTERFKKWAESLSGSESFRNFIDYVKTNGPIMLDTIGNIISFVKDLIKALAPLGAEALSGLQSLTDKMDGLIPLFEWVVEKAMDVTKAIGDNWDTIIPIVGGLAAAVGTLKLAMTGMMIVGTVTKLFKAWRAGTLAVALANMGLNATLLMSPITWIAIGLIGLVTALVLAYKNSETFRDIVNGVWKAIKKGFGAFIDFFTETIPQWVGNFVKWITSMRDKAGTIITAMKVIVISIIANMIATLMQHINNVRQFLSGAMMIIKGIFTGNFDLIKKGVVTAITALYNNVKLWLGKMGIDTDAIVKRVKNFFVNGFTTMKTRASEIMASMKKAISDKFNEIVTAAKNLPGRIGAGISSMASKVGSGISSLTSKMIGGIRSGVNGVIDGINFVLDKVGAKRIPRWGSPSKSHVPKRAGGNAENYAVGTPPGGHPGGDAIVGEEGFELGFIPGKGIKMFGLRGPEFIKNLPKGSAILPNRESQHLLKGGLPGYANGIGDFFGLLAKGAKGLISKVWENYIPALPKLGGSLADMAKGSMSFVKEKAFGFLKGKLDGFKDMGGGFAGGVAAPGQVREWIAKALQITGTSMDWMSAMIVKAKKESGFNPRAINLWDSNAKKGIPSKGLFQTIDPTFNAYKMSGMNDIYNPIHNAVAAIRYIKARYGTVFNTPGIKSMARGGAYKGYANGALFPANSPRLIGIGDNKRYQEAALPLSPEVLGMIGSKIAQEMPGDVSGNQQITLKAIFVTPDGRILAEHMSPHIQEVQEFRELKDNRGWGKLK